MRWSKLKQQIELRLAPEFAGRIKFHTSRYRNAHDGMGRSWITLDDVEVISMQHLGGEDANENPDRFEDGVFTAYDLPISEISPVNTLIRLRQQIAATTENLLDIARTLPSPFCEDLLNFRGSH